MTTIKVNGKTITIANKSNESLSFDNLDKESKSLESLALNISKSIEAFDIVSNIKAIESFGYKSTEGVGEKIKAGITAVKNKLIEWFKKLIEFFKNLQAKIVNDFFLGNESTYGKKFKELIMTFNKYAKENIEIISKNNVTNDEINKCKEKQVLCNHLRSYTLDFIKTISMTYIIRDINKITNEKTGIRYDNDTVFQSITKHQLFINIEHTTDNFINFINSILKNDPPEDGWNSKLDYIRSSLIDERESLIKDVANSLCNIK